jgi:hypothetical protein
MVTSTLDPLPITRWLSMSITYNDSAPANYEAPEFCSQDPSLQPKFPGDEPLVIAVGEVNTGFHNVDLKFRQAVPSNHEAPLTQHVGEDGQIMPSAGYDSDETAVQWQRKKEEIVAMAERIARNAQAKGEPVEIAVRSSELAKTLPEDVLSGILAQIKLASKATVVFEDGKKHQSKSAVAGTPQAKVSSKKPSKTPKPMDPPPIPTIVTQKRVSRVKRPIQQIDGSLPANKVAKVQKEEQAPGKRATDDDAMDEEAFEPAAEMKKVRQTYSKRH